MFRATSLHLFTHVQTVLLRMHHTHSTNSEEINYFTIVYNITPIQALFRSDSTAAVTHSTRAINSILSARQLSRLTLKEGQEGGKKVEKERGIFLVLFITK